MIATSATLKRASPARVALLGSCGVMAAIAVAAQPVLAAPRRIVSLNLCADQLILAIADREQIAGLTRNAADAELSAAAAQTRGLRILGSSAEEILGIAPDLIIGMPARGSPGLIALRGQRVRTLDLTSANSLADIYASIRQTAAATGHSERGEALVGQMERDLARIPRLGAGKVAAYYQRRGFLTGSGTLIDDLMRRLGLVNLATRLGKAPLAQVSLEEIVAARPDYLIVEAASDRIADQGTEMLHHPALRGIARISIPQAWTVCGGAAYVAAARSISEQLARRR